MKKKQDVSCIRDLSTLYEGATVDDIYLAYKHLGIDESSLFACIGISGANQPYYDVAGTCPNIPDSLSTDWMDAYFLYFSVF
jgi:hypothetical protein